MAPEERLAAGDNAALWVVGKVIFLCAAPQSLPTLHTCLCFSSQATWNAKDAPVRRGENAKSLWALTAAAAERVHIASPDGSPGDLLLWFHWMSLSADW